jgi:nickel transport protein
MTNFPARFATTIGAVMVLTAGADGARAHDLWLTTEGGAAARRVIVNYGHPRDRPPTVADKILDLVAVTGDRQTSLLDGLSVGVVRGAPIVRSKPFADAGRTLVAVRYDNGYWVKTGDKLYRNVSKRLAPDATDSLWSAKFAKALTGAGAPWSSVLGHELEIVPLADPAALRAGESLRVRVLFRGKPLPGAEVERGDGITTVKEGELPQFKTDAEGVATIPFDRAGPVVLAIDHRVVPSGTPEIAAADLYNATLAFNIRRGKR